MPKQLKDHPGKLRDAVSKQDLDAAVLVDPGGVSGGGKGEQEVGEKVGQVGLGVGSVSVVVPVKVDGVEVRAVVDTAAQSTIVSGQLADQLEWSWEGVRPVVLSNAQVGAKMRGFCRGDVSLQVGDLDVKWPVVVAPIGDPLLLGLDFLVKYQAVIDLPGQRLGLGECEVPTELRPPLLDRDAECRLELVRAVRVPPHGVVYAEVVGRGWPVGTVLIRESGSTKGLHIGCGVVDLREHPTVVLANVQDVGIELGAGQRVCSAERVEVIPEPVAVRTVASVGDPSLLDTERAAHGEREAGPPFEHLEIILRRLSAELSQPQREMVVQLLEEFHDVFSSHEFDIGTFEGSRHRIQLSDPTPFRERMRRTPLCYQEEEEKTLKRMLEAGVIRPSSSEWASAPVLVRKKDGSVRYCVDFRRLNAQTVRDSYPLPLIDECLDTLNGTEWFSSLDMASGYWQIQLQPEDCEKTAFLTKFGLFEHVRMGFGLCNAPATFARVMNVVLADLTYSRVVVYLDDIIVLGKTFEEHLANLRAVFRRFRLHNLKLKPKKCILLQRDLEFLGRRVSRGGISVQEAKTKTVVDWPVPKNQSELASFLGTVNYHREFIQGYAGLAEPLYRVQGTKAAFQWGPEQESAFSRLKSALTSAPLLAFPNQQDTFILDCDASNLAIGAELSQVQEGKERVVAYSSYVLTPAQRKYCTTRKELLALVTFTRHFRHYLLGRSFLARTDHASLTWLMRFRHVEGQLARWLEELSQYDVQVVHRKGKLHSNADGLSRIPAPGDTCLCYQAGRDLESLPCGGCAYCKRVHLQWERFQEEVDDVVPIAVRAITEVDDPWAVDSAHSNLTELQGFSPAELRSRQLEDPELAAILRWLEKGQPGEAEFFRSGPLTKQLWSCRSQLVQRKGVLLYRWEDGARASLKLVVPASLREEALRAVHDTKAGGHFGVLKTLEKLRDVAYWPGMGTYVQTYVRSCLTCQLNKKYGKTPRHRLGDYQAGARLERVHLDLLGPFPISDRGNRYVLMVVDQFTKWLSCIALPDQSAGTVGERFFEEFVTLLGCPTQIHTDQGRNFQSAFFGELLQSLEIVKTRTTPYRPSSNGQVERYNRSVLQFLRCYLDGHQRAWDKHLPAVAMALRASVSAATGFSPNFLMFGEEVKLPAALFLGLPALQAEKESPSEHASAMGETLRKAFAAVRERLKVSQQRAKRYYDKGQCVNAYGVGDIVLKLDSSCKVGQSKKLQPVYKGPLVVEDRLSPCLYRVQGRRRSEVLHHDRLRPATLRELPHWLRRRRHQLLGQSNPEAAAPQESGEGAPGLIGDNVPPADGEGDGEAGPEQDGADPVGDGPPTANGGVDGAPDNPNQGELGYRSPSSCPGSPDGSHSSHPSLLTGDQGSPLTRGDQGTFPTRGDQGDATELPDRDAPPQGPSPHSPPVVKTRSGRTVRPPPHLEDYVT